MSEVFVQTSVTSGFFYVRSQSGIPCRSESPSAIGSRQIRQTD
uniref:Uncharacterized protein n=1 Tax=Faecalibaculum rodentium TaxID=1702221 RepID=A0A140DS14_9FIRM|nr:hypothetical protein AALO17_03070 [Faecalibaculum rodentium]